MYIYIIYIYIIYIYISLYIYNIYDTSVPRLHTFADVCIFTLCRTCTNTGVFTDPYFPV